MTYSDEVARLSTVQLAKRKRYMQDIDSLIRDYERLVVAEGKYRRRAESLDKDLRAMRRARDKAMAQLDAANRSNNELKSVLKALRSSKSFRLARAIGVPARWLSRAAVAPRRSAGNGSISPSALGGRTAAEATRSIPGKTPSAKATVPARPTRHQLLNDFATHPSKAAALKLISHDYFDRGAILQPADFIRQHAALLEDVGGSELVLLQNILGQYELLTAPPFIAQRQPNAGYLAEHGRIMYCAHSTGHFNSNGYSTRTAGVVGGLRSNGEDVVVVARPGYPWDSKVDVPVAAAERFVREISGVQHVFNPGPSWTGDRLDYYLAEATDVYVREAQRHRASVIHAASNYVTALPALLAARRLGIPFVYEVRGLWEITQASSKPAWRNTDRFRLAMSLDTLVAKEADSVLAITSQVRDELVSRGVSGHAISLLPNAVDTDAFTPMPPLESLRKKLGLASDTTVVGYAGSIVPYEGLEDLLEAAKFVLDAGVDITVVVVGDGAELAALKRQATEFGIRDKVIFAGRVAAADVPGYLSLFDIMPCPRRRLPVTELVSPLKPLEAMASAKALILSDLAPMRDLAGPNQERALLCEAGSPESLAAAIIKLTGDPEARTSMGRRARLWAIDQRTWRAAGSTAVRAHDRAKAATAATSARNLNELTIGIISDEFTLEGLRGEVNLVELRPDCWREQIAAQPLDALFVESAWEGLNGLWKQKVGYYDEARFSTLKEILEDCNTRDVPTIFWNKEDPVHFNRFRETSRHFDHVFTSDSDCIRRYKENAGPRQKTVASLTFYAQPRLHNIIPANRPYDHTVAYAGSYYGDRYKNRSEELATILGVAKNHGLAVYDRQHLNPESPYRFPANLSRFVRGGLAYPEMVEAYKAHPVHINVNSVDASPTMFSRRVMELAASGSAVVSGKGLGVEQIMNGLVPVVRGADEAGLLIQEWMSNERSRNRDAWLAYRYVHRGHTAAHRLAYLLRTAGLTVAAPELPSYAVYVPELTAEVASVLGMQTVQPAHVYCALASTESRLPVTVVSDRDAARRLAEAAGISFMGEPGTGHSDRTIFEDLLTPTTFGAWSSISISSEELDTPGLGLAQLGEGNGHEPLLRNISGMLPANPLRLRREVEASPTRPTNSRSNEPKNVLIAGHDLKFATGIIGELASRGHNVTIDKWQDHTRHDEEQSQTLLAEADVVFCEWTLGNAVWYSRNVSPHQRLVTRLHLQEISRPYVRDVAYSAVDKVIFVGKHILDVAVRDHGVPAKQSLVIPNPVDVTSLDLDKAEGARFNLGFVGIVPARKRLDKALDVLRLLRMNDDRYHLFIKGKRPEDFPWMANRPDEMFFYEEQYARIGADPLLAGAVTFDAQGDDMAEWYRKIGIVLSVSDFESFHLTLADGAASGAVPASLAWPGADQIYPTDWLHADERAMAVFLSGLNEDSWRIAGARAKDIVDTRFESTKVIPELVATILGGDEG